MTTTSTHRVRAEELIRLCLVDRHDEADLLLETVPNDQAIPLARALLAHAGHAYTEGIGADLALVLLALMKEKR